MDWYTTWQDPIAIGMAALFLAFARWLSRRVERGGCSACSAKQLGADRPRAAAKVVRLEHLSLSRRRGAR